LEQKKAYEIPKKSAEDTSLTIENIHGEKKVIPVPAGTAITLCPIALHYNRKTFRKMTILFMKPPVCSSVLA
jgi:hypothetical protein